MSASGRARASTGGRVTRPEASRSPAMAAEGLDSGVIAIGSAMAFSLRLASAAPAEPTVGVVPLEVEGELAATWREEVDQRLGLALRRGAVEIVDLAEATESCSGLECRLRAAQDVGADYLLVSRLTVEPGARDYALTFEVLVADGGKQLAVIDGSCELCGFEEAVNMVEARTVVVLSTLERSHARGSALSLRTDPPGARIEIDGRDMGVTPLELELPAGIHRIVATKPGHLPQSLEIEAVEGIKKSLEVQLLPEPVRVDPSARALTIGGAVTLGLGVASLVGGVVLLVVHDEPYRRDCQADDDGDCRFLLGTRTGGIVAASLGAAGLAGGAAMLGVGLRRKGKGRARVELSAAPGLRMHF